MQPFKSLDLAGTTGPGTSKDLEDCYGTHTLQVTAGTTTVVVLALLSSWKVP